ncbi:MAG: polysaccharide deacetylase family protein [Thiotrichales bacterium]|nr:polysaccharide deacetylase family protein [Thiotrichales bacterium]
MVDITFTLDLEDHRPEGFEKRYPQITQRILGFLEQHGIRATVFVLGRVAEESPELIRKISTAGHEIAYHTRDHTHLYKTSETAFTTETDAGKKFLEDLIGEPVYGFRAPAFSLVKSSLWAVDVIREAGFRYSSSVLPVANPINGFPGAPRHAFCWPNGLLEIPAAITRLGPLQIPYLGGFYLRYLPFFMIRSKLDDTSDKQEHWLYCHPHDFDHGEPYYTIPGTSVLTSLLLWVNRSRTFSKLEKLFSVQNVSAGKCFIDQVNAGRFEDAPVFNAVS